MRLTSSYFLGFFFFVVSIQAAPIHLPANQVLQSFVTYGWLPRTLNLAQKWIYGWMGYKRATVCNGSAVLCSRSYGNITHIGAHNSYAVSKNPLSMSANQNVDVLDQLNRGIHLLQGAVHLEGEEMRFCHTSCYLYDGGLLLDYLMKVKGWMDTHPQEVLTLILTNPDGADLTQYWRPQFASAGLESMIYVPTEVWMPRDSWPTLGQLIDSGRRVVVFLDYDADPSQVNYLLPEFANMWETPFTVTDANILRTCNVDRVWGSPSGKMYMINHSLNYRFLGTGAIVPDRKKASTTNSLEWIMTHANECAKLGEGRWPNFILLDWIDVGAGFEALRKLNRL